VCLIQDEIVIADYHRHHHHKKIIINKKKSKKNLAGSTWMRQDVSSHHQLLKHQGVQEDNKNTRL
jgi:ribosomal protein L21